MTSALGSSQRAGQWARLWAVTLLVLSLTFALTPIGTQPVYAKRRPFKSSSLKLLGRLPEVPADQRVASWVVGVDDRRRLMYYVYKAPPDIFLREYDLRPSIPRLRREARIDREVDFDINYGSPYTMQIDTKRRWLILLGEPEIRIFDLETMKILATWDLTTVLPGYYPQGMTYSQKDGRIYLVGSPAGISTVSVVRAPARITAVVALDATGSPKQGPRVAWVRPVAECQQPLDTFIIRALIARSKLQNALYFACARLDPYPGESGVVRLWIDPKGEQSAAPGFDVDFFPISGSYTGIEGAMGVAAFDYATDRFFMQSIAPETPGAWVLDGRLSAWIGFVAAPNNFDRYLGFDSGSGHFYLSSGGTGDGGYLLVSDGRATPVPQGELIRGLGTAGFILTDPRTHRMFVPVELDKFGYGEGQGYVVLKDKTPLGKPPRAPDFDELTSMLSEGPKTVTSFSGGVNGFGARVVVVGGYGGVLSASGQRVAIPSVRSGDRGFTAGRVPSLDLRTNGSTAAAQSFLTDSNTDAERYERGIEDWPWPIASCFDGGGDPQKKSSEGPGGTSRVSCSLDRENADASSTFGQIEAGGVSVASGSFQGRTYRDSKKGIVTETISAAKGIELSSPSGTVSIAKVEAVATTVAHGHPGTAKAQWQRVVSGIEVKDADGKVVQRVGECISAPKEDECEQVFAQANEVLQTKMHIELPEPQVIDTPKGAFAAVQQSDAAFYHSRTVNNQGTTFSAEPSSRAVPAMEIIVYNDSIEKSRLVVQLAALQTNSIYTISPMVAPPAIDLELPDPPETATQSGAGTGATGVGSPPSLSGSGSSIGGSSPSSATAAIPVRSVPASIRGALAFFVRSPKEGLLIAGVWLLFAGAALSVVRRQALLGLLIGTKD